jgi:hypothetical protein
MEEIISNVLMGTGTVTVGAAGAYFYHSRLAGQRILVPPRDSQLPHVTEVRVKSGALIDSVSFVLSDGGVNTYGGRGGTDRPSFVLGEGEYIVSVAGRCGAFVDQLQFTSSTGRKSEVYGGPGGEPFEMDLQGEPIAGLMVFTSARGWLRMLEGAVSLRDVVEAMDISSASARAAAVAAGVTDGSPLGFVQHHRHRLRRTWIYASALASAYAAVWLGSMVGLLADVATGPHTLSAQAGTLAHPHSHSYVSAEHGTLNATKESSWAYMHWWPKMEYNQYHQYQVGKLLWHNWGVATFDGLDLDVLLSRDTEHADHQPLVGLLESLAPDLEEVYGHPSPRDHRASHYLDTSFSPALFVLVAVLVACLLMK